MKRRALGKGLSSLIPLARERQEPLPPVNAPAESSEQLARADRLPGSAEQPAEVGTAGQEQIRRIDISAISPNPRQPRQRIPEEQLEELAASIRNTGVLQPILVRSNQGTGAGYQLIAGERRWRAARKAGLETILAIVRDVPDESLLEVALIENIQREELNPIEEARAYQALQREMGMSQADVADRVGKQRSTVANIVRLLNLPRSIQERVETGALSMGHARALLGLVDPRAQENISQAIINKGLSVRQAEELVRRSLEAPHVVEQVPRRDPNVAAAEEELCRSLGTKVTIVQNRKGSGKVVIEFYSDEELQRLYEALRRESPGIRPKPARPPESRRSPARRGERNPEGEPRDN